MFFSREPQPQNVLYLRQALLWFIMTILFVVLAIFLWTISKTTLSPKTAENKNQTDPSLAIPDFIQPKKIDQFGELDNSVKPISFDTVIRDLRKYPDSFKDKRYLVANKGKWTIQVMNVAEHDVIADYLSGRDEDKEKFAYFRYRDENNQPRYMLIYGIMSSPQEAIGVSKIINFGLPDNVQVMPEEINRYLNIIDNYEKAEPIRDLAKNRPRTVKLTATKHEVAVRRPEPPRPKTRPTPVANPESKADDATPSPDQQDASQQDAIKKAAKTKSRPTSTTPPQQASEPSAAASNPDIPESPSQTASAPETKRPHTAPPPKEASNNNPPAETQTLEANP